MVPKGISPEIDQCSGLIYSRAVAAYNRISPEHKRWVDLQDVVNEGVIAALNVKNFDAEKGSKFSTYLFAALDWHFSKFLHAPLEAKKRKTALVELDKQQMGEDDTPAVQLEDKNVDLTDVFRPGMVVEMCQYLNDRAVLLLSKMLLGSHLGSNFADEASQLQAAAQKVKLSMDDMRQVINNQTSSRSALTGIGKSVNNRVSTELEQTKILECVNCTGRFTLKDIGTGKFVPDTMTCRACYRKMAAAPSTVSCFGKVKSDAGEGYCETDVECRLHCKDRAACKQIITKGKIMADNDVDILDDVDLDDVLDTAPETTVETQPVADGEAPAISFREKKYKAPKPDKVKQMSEEEKAEKALLAKYPQLGRRLPHKRGSGMRYAFVRCLGGVPLETLKNELTASGERCWPIYLMVLRSGRSGKKPTTHTWTLNEEGGILKVENVKYVGDQKE